MMGAFYRSLRGPRGAVLQAVLWLLLGLLLWQLLWQPGQQRLRLAEQALAREQAFSRQLQQLSATPDTQGGQALTPARVSEGAQAAGLQVIELHTRDGRLEASVQGAASSLLQWLHELERGGARLSELQLQVRDQQMQVRMGVALDAQ